MKKIVKFAVINSGVPYQLPGYTVLTIKDIESVSKVACGSDPIGDVVKMLIEKIVRKNPITKLNCILGFSVVSFYDGVNRRLAAYGNPAYIEHVTGLKAEIIFCNYEIDV